MSNTSPQSKAQAERPLSPHIQVYRWQMTMTMSILHRISGGALAIGLIAFTWMLLAAASGPEAWGTFTSVAGSWIGKLALFGWTVAIWYHMGNGIRHLVWDTGHALDIPHAYRAGYIVWAFTIVMTLLTCWAVYALGKG
jgi:succinate dehydrogenase / fumarate reductase cytochrome b subunit